MKKAQTLVILQARMSSSRLPGKVIKLINSEPMIIRQIARIRQSTTIDDLIVATSNDPTDDTLAELLSSKGIKVSRGSLDDVLSRFKEIERQLEPTTIVRLTGDCPLVMPELITKMVEEFLTRDVDYLSNTLEPTFPDGLDIEIFRASALRKLVRLELSDTEREHVTLGMYRRPLVFTLANHRAESDLSQERWTVDYPDDFEFVKQIFSEFQGRESIFSFQDVVDFLHTNPSIRSNISADRRNEQLGGH